MKDSKTVWPFVESPGEFADRLSKALEAFNGNVLSAVRNVLIENPAIICYQDNFNKEFFDLRDALQNWPRLPPAYVLMWLQGKFPEDWERGVAIQRELGLAVIPPKTECEKGAGLWDRITQGAWRTVKDNSKELAT